MKQLAVEVRVRNNLLLERRKKTGLNQRDFSYAADVHVEKYTQLETMKISPLQESGGVVLVWSETATKLAEFYEVAPEELFPEAIRNITKPVIRRTFDVDDLRALPEQQRVALLLPESTDDLANMYDLKNKVEQVLETLDPREQEIIKRHFFGEETLAEIGCDVGSASVTWKKDKRGRRKKVVKLDKSAPIVAGRVGQIEAKALRKLRHPSRSNLLRAFADTYIDHEKYHCPACKLDTLFPMDHTPIPTRKGQELVWACSKTADVKKLYPWHFKTLDGRNYMDRLAEWLCLYAYNHQPPVSMFQAYEKKVAEEQDRKPRRIYEWSLGYYENAKCSTCQSTTREGIVAEDRGKSEFIWCPHCHEWPPMKDPQVPA